MPHRRRPAHAITPAYEDNGLFKQPVRRVTVALVPRISHNMRGDMIVRGFAEPGIEIAVVFAGRRARNARPLEARLGQMMFQARGAHAGGHVDVDQVRLMVRIEGAWRPRFARASCGWETRSYQLLAARWGLFDAAGMSHLFGEAPHPAIADQAMASERPALRPEKMHPPRNVPSSAL